MKNHLWLALSVLAVAAAWGCNDEIKVENRTFQQLCEMSGGVYIQQTTGQDEVVVRYCQCGGVSCDVGVVCLGHGEYCADGSEQCTSEVVGKLSCKDRNGVGQIRVCKELDEGKYGYQNYSDIATENFNEKGFCRYKCPTYNEDNILSNELNNLCREQCSQNEEDCYVENVSCAGAICGVCIDGEKECRNDNGISGEYLCENGKWVYSLPCADGASCQIEEYRAVCGQCKDGDEKCDNDDKRGIISKCVNGSWIKNDNFCPESHSCSADKKECGECVNEKFKCMEGNLYVCQAGAWSNPVACFGEHSCTESDEVIYDNFKCGECADGDQRCMPGRIGTDENENAKIQVCSGGVWTDIENGECVDQLSCDDSGKLCASCKSGEKKCLQGPNGVGLYYQCVDEKWTEAVTCPNATSCLYEHIENDLYKDDSFVCGVCRDGKTQCVTEESVSKIQECVKGMWEDQKDKNDGQCKGNISDISFNVSCNAHDTACGECFNNTKKCENGIQYECVNGQWSNAVVCVGGSSCQNADGDSSYGYDKNGNQMKCGECVDGEQKCIPGDSADSRARIQICEVGEWLDKIGLDSTPVTCPTSACDITGKVCDACVNGETRCLDDDEKGSKLYTCSENKWTVNSCKWSCSLDKNACGDCINNNIRYSEETSMIQKCISGSWFDWDDKIIDDVSVCVDNKLYYLEIEGDNIITKSKDCADKCNNNTCTPKCTEGATRCSNDGKLQSCGGDGKWVNNIACSNSCKYFEGRAECGDCNNGEKQCIGVDGTSESKQFKEQTCVVGVWQNDTPCGDNSCNIEKVCGECRNNSERCFEHENGIGEMQICINGKWTTNVNKSNVENLSCNQDNSNYGNCRNGNFKCDDKNDGIGEMYQCDSGVWASLSVCSGVSCNATMTACGECKNETTKCENDNISKVGYFSVCRSGSWNTGLCPKASYGGYLVCNNNIQYASMCKDSSQCGDCNHLIGEEWKWCNSNFKFKCTVENILEYDN